MDYEPNPYDPEDPRYDEFEVEHGDSVTLASTAFENPYEAEAEKEYQRVYGGGPQPVRSPSEGSARGRGQWQGGSLVWDAVDWSM